MCGKEGLIRVANFPLYENDFYKNEMENKNHTVQMKWEDNKLPKKSWTLLCI